MTDEELEALIARQPMLTERQKKLLRDYYHREDKDPNNGVADYVYGLDDEFAERGAPNFN